jgi:biotin operon repressor
MRTHRRWWGLAPPLPSKSAVDAVIAAVVRRCHGRIENVCDHGGVTREQRRQAIERMLAEEGSVTQQSIAASLGVSQKTVSRDLEELKQRGGLVTTNSSGRGRPRGSTVNPQVSGGDEVSPGEALVARVRAEMAENGLEPDGKEIELLALASRLADRLAELEEAISRDGLTGTVNSRVVLNACVPEARQHAAALARVLSGVQMERSVKDPVKQRAAATRWRQHNIAKMTRYDGADGGA